MFSPLIGSNHRQPVVETLIKAETSGDLAKIVATQMRELEFLRQQLRELRQKETASTLQTLKEKITIQQGSARQLESELAKAHEFLSTSLYALTPAEPTSIAAYDGIENLGSTISHSLEEIAKKNKGTEEFISQSLTLFENMKTGHTKLSQLKKCAFNTMKFANDLRVLRQQVEQFNAATSDLFLKMRNQPLEQCEPVEFADQKEALEKLYSQTLQTVAEVRKPLHEFSSLNTKELIQTYGFKQSSKDEDAITQWSCCCQNFIEFLDKQWRKAAMEWRLAGVKWELAECHKKLKPSLDALRKQVRELQHETTRDKQRHKEKTKTNVPNLSPGTAPLSRYPQLHQRFKTLIKEWHRVDHEVEMVLQRIEEKKVWPLDQSGLYQPSYGSKEVDKFEKEKYSLFEQGKNLLTIPWKTLHDQIVTLKVHLDEMHHLSNPVSKENPNDKLFKEKDSPYPVVENVPMNDLKVDFPEDLTNPHEFVEGFLMVKSN